MLFLASLIFAFLMYVLPGEIGLNVLAVILAGKSGFPAWVSLAILNIAAYSLIFYLIRFTQFSYELLQYDREPSHKVLKDFLNVRGCHWLNFAGMLLIGTGAVILFLKGALSYQFAFLFGAIVLGFSDIIKKSKLIESKEPFFDPRQNLDIKPDANMGGTRSLCWTFREHGTDHSAVKHEIVFRIVGGALADKPKVVIRTQSDCAMVLESCCSPEIIEIASRLRKLSEERGYNAVQEAQNVVCMAGSLIGANCESHEGIFCPVCTALDSGVGKNYSDATLLAAVILHVLGHRVGLFSMDVKEVVVVGLAWSTEAILKSYCRMSEDGDAYYLMDIPLASESCAENDAKLALIRGVAKAKLLTFS